ncbi:MAG: sulfite exporter TauE/SafE family protein [Myxococcales bacterium]|nr:sulfite exporter TauE/SafE family protein [Myxococcales bacterium]
MDLLDPYVILAGLGVGFVVGLTGMGGGALMTPLLVLLFGVPPLTAVSSDIVAAMVMKPVGGTVHWKRGTVNLKLVGWLVAGSVPTAFLGVLLLRELGAGPDLQAHVKLALGFALLAVTFGLVIRPLLAARRKPGDSMIPLQVKPLPTLFIGIVGGLVVGLTSVGSGSLMMILLLLLYPRLKLSELVGTDLVQAVPLVASAAIGHLLFGDFELGLTGSILVGSLPGVFLGARFSSRAPDYVIRPALIVVLLASGLKLLSVGTGVLATAVGTAAAIGVAHGVMEARRERQARQELEVASADGPLPAPEL